MRYLKIGLDKLQNQQQQRKERLIFCWCKKNKR